MSVHSEYSKNKEDYLRLNELVGGNKKNKIVIHISGASGAGKTTLGKKLSDKFGKKIIVKDVDDLRKEFVEKTYGGYDKMWNIKNFIWDHEAYQLYIDKFVKKQTKPLVFVGLNHMPWWNKNLYYNMHSYYNYYIEIDDMMVVKQKCIRFITNDLQNIAKDKYAMADLVNDNRKFVKLTKKRIEFECGTRETTKENKVWTRDYKKQGYKFMTRDKIFSEVSKILNKHL
jgi:hypothetical protein